MKLGYLQEELLRIAIEQNRVTINYAKKLYGSTAAARSALLKLQTKGYLQVSGMGEWKPTQKSKERK